MLILIIIPLLVAAIVQVIKLTIDNTPNNLNWQHLFADYGGMPSSHSALVASLATAIALREGFGSAAFAVSLILLFIVVRDASGFRAELGKNAILTNMLAQEVFPENPEVLLHEQIGHKNKEIAVGLLLGVALTILFFWVIMGF